MITMDQSTANDFPYAASNHTSDESTSKNCPPKNPPGSPPAGNAASPPPPAAPANNAKAPPQTPAPPKNGKSAPAPAPKESASPPAGTPKGNGKTPAKGPETDGASTPEQAPEDALPNTPLPEDALPDTPLPEEEAGSPSKTPPKDPPSPLTYQDVANHHANAEKEYNALYTLTTDGNYEKVAGADGKLSLQEAQEYLKNNPTGPLADALRVITTNGDFERLAGGPGKELTLEQLQQATVEAYQEMSSLDTIMKNFNAISGDDDKINLLDAQAAAETTTDPAVKEALNWLTTNNHFEQTGNTSYNDKNGADGQVTTNFKQAREGNCATLAVIQGLINTPEGKKLLENIIQLQPDGSYNVTFPGDPDRKIYNITEADLQNGKYASGDKDVQILAAARDKYAADHPNVNVRSAGAIMTLLTGQPTQGDIKAGNPAAKDSVADATQGKTTEDLPPAEKIKDFLAQHADAVNNGNTVMTIAGKAKSDASGNFSGPCDHSYTITKIDLANGTVTYKNPWNPNVEYTISFDQLIKEVTAPESESFFNLVNLNPSTPTAG